jgi:hypothetical protein
LTIDSEFGNRTHRRFVFFNRGIVREDECPRSLERAS